MNTPKPTKQQTVAPAPPPPTIDEAAQNAEMADRARMRRGRLANLFASQRGGGGYTASATTLGGK